ncbi:GxxExxY protein [Parabacteroides sp. PFB2-12]|uniref:GxxExxY protein n=1 Tax=unclassified Parabacteroides TaxID=2649774 RepID=UPI0024758E47|nr:MULTISPECIES: GxxExxY protein [unclassified Parabacteroides]MDH6342242.1 GxxExxY protein [Parabacteroides sp. PM6-13]MDH6392231.1 GxxExxY protein [Parabacteroides sp. PFB2-12]
MVTTEQERIATIVLNCAFEVHTELGPGLLENAYQKCLAYELRKAGLFVEEEKEMPLVYKGELIDCGYRVDILVERDQLIIENKAVKAFTDIHFAQTINYMKLSEITLGFLFNFNVRHLKEGIKRIVL